MCHQNCPVREEFLAVLEEPTSILRRFQPYEAGLSTFPMWLYSDPTEKFIIHRQCIQGFEA